MDISAPAGRVALFDDGDAIAAGAEPDGGGEAAEPAADDERVGFLGPTRYRVV